MVFRDAVIGLGLTLFQGREPAPELLDRAGGALYAAKRRPPDLIRPRLRRWL